MQDLRPILLSGGPDQLKMIKRTISPGASVPAVQEYGQSGSPHASAAGTRSRPPCWYSGVSEPPEGVGGTVQICDRSLHNSASPLSKCINVMKDLNIEVAFLVLRPLAGRLKGAFPPPKPPDQDRLSQQKDYSLNSFSCQYSRSIFSPLHCTHLPLPLYRHTGKFYHVPEVCQVKDAFRSGHFAGRGEKIDREY